MKNRHNSNEKQSYFQINASFKFDTIERLPSDKYTKNIILFQKTGHSYVCMKHHFIQS